MPTNYTNRGKVAEALVHKQLKILATQVNFDFERITDAYSSRGGSTVARPGDFLAFQDGKSFVLEIKEVAHDYRLPKGNFKQDQRARMLKRNYAGCHGYVLIFSSTARVWWMLPVTYFGSEATGSWDLRLEPTNSLAGHLSTIFTYPKGVLHVTA